MAALLGFLALNIGIRVWLPNEAAVETGPPGWVPKEHHDRPVYRVVIRLRRAVVNQPKAEWFRP